MLARRLIPLACSTIALAALATTASAQDDKKEDKLEDRAKSAAHVLANLVSDPKNAPPNKLLRSAVCMAIIPEREDRRRRGRWPGRVRPRLLPRR